MRAILITALSAISFIALAVPLTSSAADFSHPQICRAAIGAMMGRAPSIIRVDKVSAGVVHVSYKRPDDGTSWSQRCRIEGAKIIWATASGRWRDHPSDEQVTYAATPTSLTIHQKFGDGSSSAKTFTRQQLAQN